MLKYIKKAFRKVKDDALSKALYDFVKYLIEIFIAYLVLNKIPLTTAIGRFLHKSYSVGPLQIFISIACVIIITSFIQHLITSKRFALIKKDLNTDQLTNLPNSRALDEELKINLGTARKEKKNLSIIMMDIDDFKKFNTIHGQITADEVLRKLGILLKSDNRITDKIYRQHVKGDEFIIIAKETNLNNALLAANRKRELIEKTRIQIENVLTPFTLTVCCGVVEFNFEKDNEVTILERAHKAMLYAKEIPGKNHIQSLI